MAYINLGQVIYPVGAIYASANSTSPASLFGGSWTQITNAALRGATGVGYTGSDTHTLTIKEIPSHRHVFSHWFYSQGGNNSPVPCNYESSINKPGTEAGASVGEGQHIPTCNAPTTVICGNAQDKSPRGDVA